MTVDGTILAGNPPSLITSSGQRIAIQNTACSDPPGGILIRNDADGTITNAATLNDFEIDGGLINVAGSNKVSIYINYTAGSLTAVSISLRFHLIRSTAAGDTFHHRAQIIDPGSEIVAIDDNEILYTMGIGTDELTIIDVAIPAAVYMSLWTSSAGTVTGSSAQIWIMRGNSPTNVLTV